MTKYGIPIEPHAAPHQQMYQLLLSHAPYHPIETYALAASHGLEDVAVVASGHLLSYDMTRLTDELVTKMGAIYLKRLVLLHQERMTALRHILLQAPRNHSPTPGCGDLQQGQLIREWALSTAQLAWDATPSKGGHFTSGTDEAHGQLLRCWQVYLPTHSGSTWNRWGRRSPAQDAGGCWWRGSMVWFTRGPL